MKIEVQRRVSTGKPYQDMPEWGVRTLCFLGGLMSGVVLSMFTLIVF